LTGTKIKVSLICPKTLEVKAIIRDNGSRRPMMDEAASKMAAKAITSALALVGDSSYNPTS
jgi:hypothetical protein